MNKTNGGETVRIKLDAQLAKKLDEQCELLKMAKTDLVRVATEMVASFNPTVWLRVKFLAARLQLPPYLILENLAITLFARDAAFQEVYGIAPRVRPEFIFIDGDEGVLTGSDLFSELEERYRQVFEQVKPESEAVPCSVPAAALGLGVASN